MSVVIERNMWTELRGTLAVKDPDNKTVLTGAAGIFAGFRKYGIETRVMPDAISLLCAPDYIIDLDKQFQQSTCQARARFTRTDARVDGRVTPESAVWHNLEAGKLDLVAATVLRTPEGDRRLEDVEAAGLIDKHDVPTLHLGEALRLVAAERKQARTIASLSSLALGEGLIDRNQAAAISAYF